MSNPTREVDVFFYGSFMNEKVLSKAGVSPRNLRAAKLSDYSIVISPRATIKPNPDGILYGLVGRLSHAELDKIYAKDWFGFGAYVPEAVILEVDSTIQIPALCYICWGMEPAPTTEEYISLMLEVGEQYKFPASYLHEISSFVSG
ncbi:MAG: gamma-glutamylcyclotransferase family protein [Sedimenticola sp.]